MKILLTTTSFQDTPGAHHDLLAQTGWEIIRARGPLNEADTLALVGDAEGYICGDDAITRKVLEKARPKLKVISKYGIGVDKIDVKSCTEFGIPVLFTPGVNHTTVAEHTFLLLLALEKNFLFHTDSTPQRRMETQDRPRTAGKDHRHRRPGPHRQGSRHPRPRLRHEPDRLRHLLGREIREGTRRETRRVARRDFCRQRLHFAAHEPHAGNARHDQRRRRSPK